MSKLAITLATAEYDYLRPLRDRQVEPEGIDLNLIHVECGARHSRMMDDRAYDASEFSMGSYLVARASGVDWMQAIPFFTRKMFAHRFFFVRAGSDVRTPRDLVGRRVGLLSYQNSLAIFAKAILAHGYGVSLEDVTWVTTGKERVAVPLPEGVRVERASSQSLERLLLSGEIDALVQPDLPEAWLDGSGRVTRLFTDYEREERSYHRATGLFPIMHAVVVKQSILDRHPWVATSLYDALARSRELYSRFMRESHRLSFAWPPVEEELRFFGKDPFSPGLSANQHDLMGMLDYAREQGLVTRPLAPQELFTALRT
ncbi:MAG: ABC transporter substrate-binding protein [Polyangiaceae bacterium]